MFLGLKVDRLMGKEQWFEFPQLARKVNGAVSFLNFNLFNPEFSERASGGEAAFWLVTSVLSFCLALV